MTDQDLKVGEWQEEEVEVPALEMEAEFDANGFPVRLIPHQTTRKVKQRYQYAKLLPHQICAPEEHYFELRNGGKRVAGRLEVQCRACSFGRNFVLGYHQLVDGKIITQVNAEPTAV